jgi:DNA-directed RNA polymerase specialized sigma subunit
VYRYCYEQGQNADVCYQTIKTDFPELTSDQISASLSRIHSLLTPRQRWKLSLHNRGRSSAGTDISDALMGQIADPGPTPDSLAQTEEEVASLKMALSRLKTDQQLLLHLRFQEGLTFRRIAQVEHLGDAHRARRHIQAALDALYIQLQKTNIGQKRQN